MVSCVPVAMSNGCPVSELVKGKQKQFRSLTKQCMIIYNYIFGHVHCKYIVHRAKLKPPSLEIDLAQGKLSFLLFLFAVRLTFAAIKK